MHPRWEPSTQITGDTSAPAYAYGPVFSQNEASTSTHTKGDDSGTGESGQTIDPHNRARPSGRPLGPDKHPPDNRFVLDPLARVLLYSNALGAHNHHLDNGQTLLNDSSIRLRLSKCCLYTNDIESFGHIVSSSRIKQTHSHITAHP